MVTRDEIRKIQNIIFNLMLAEDTTPEVYAELNEAFNRLTSIFMKIEVK